jgi:hypothetical protein
VSGVSESAQQAIMAVQQQWLEHELITNVHINGSYGLAYKVADFTTWLDAAGQASDEPVLGSHLWVLREVSPDHWRVAVVAWSIAGPTKQPG